MNDHQSPSPEDIKQAHLFLDDLKDELLAGHSPGEVYQKLIEHGMSKEQADDALDHAVTHLMSDETLLLDRIEDDQERTELADFIGAAKSEPEEGLKARAWSLAGGCAQGVLIEGGGGQGMTDEHLGEVANGIYILISQGLAPKRIEQLLMVRGLPERFAQWVVKVTKEAVEQEKQDEPQA